MDEGRPACVVDAIEQRLFGGILPPRRNGGLHPTTSIRLQEGGQAGHGLSREPPLFSRRIASMFVCDLTKPKHNPFRMPSACAISTSLLLYSWRAFLPLPPLVQRFVESGTCTATSFTHQCPCPRTDDRLYASLVPYQVGQRLCSCLSGKVAGAVWI